LASEPRTAVPVALASALVARLPLAGASAGKGFGLGAMGGDRAVLNVERNLPDGERGPHHQARLRSTLYRERRDAPLREAVVYASFDGRQCSDSPRAIHEELVRREVPLEHLWVVRDGRARVPARGREVAEGSTEHYEAMATARYLVVNDALPAWFERRPDQVVVQTFAGTPIKRVGLDVAAMPPTVRRFQSPWRSDTGAQWQHALSPSPFATPILRRAFAMEGELHETGAPRSDRLEPAALGERSARLRERLGIGADTRVNLYAPTYRDHAIDHRGRPRIDLHLDVDALRAALGGQDAVVLFRKHHLVLDPAPSTADGFIRDASAFPDGSELLLAADVLVTDYCSLMVDFAATGRPVVLYAYDLEAYRDDVRGLYVDLEAEGPGPIARTTEELGALLAELPAGPVPAARAAAFARRMGAPADGAATRRAVERIFGV
jgi:CDP-glycerol glycerophosphotransferase